MCKRGGRRLRLKEFFLTEDAPTQLPSRPKFYKKKPWTPPEGRDKSLDAYCDTLTTLVSGYIPPPLKKCNLNKDNRRALSELRELVKSRSIRISVADKGGSTVVQDVADYEAEALRQLNNPIHYKSLTYDPTVPIAKQSNDFVEELKNKTLIDDNCHRWALLDLDQVRTSVFYHLPKVHKDPLKPPGRPIVSGCNGPTEKLSKLVEHWLQPLVQQLQSNIKDTTHFLQIVEGWKTCYSPLPPEALLVTIDVVGLYTNIPHPEVALSLTDSLATNRHLVPEAPPTALFLKIIDHILKNNVFQFDGKFFQQIFGTAMGTPMAPTIANIFMGWMETNILNQCPWIIDLDMWRRYIDDIITLWFHGEEELHRFMAWLNQQHPSIQFTYNFGRKNIAYLDVSISISNEGLITTDLHVKPTDAAMILPFHSCHPRHCTRSIPYSQCLRLRRICSEESFFRARCEELKDKLTKRGYPSRLLEAAVLKVSGYSRASVLQYQRTDEPKNSRVPFVIRHNPSNPPLSRWLKQFLPVLHSSARMRKVVTEPPIVGERNCLNLRATLMPSALPPTTTSTASMLGGGCHPCSGCVLCKTHLQDTNTFCSVVTGRSYFIRDNVTCISTNVIYLIDCAQCHSTQYVGETGLTVRRRFYGHTYAIRKGLDTLVARHFVSPGHSLADMRCTVIEQVKATDAAVRKLREKFWRHKLHTNFPDGLNVLD